MALCCSLWSPWTQTWLHIEKGTVFRSFSKHCLLRYQGFPSGGSERLPTARSRKQEHWTFRATFHRNPSVPFALWVHLDLCMIFLSTVSFIDLLKVIPRHGMNVIQGKQIVLIDMVHRQSHGKSRRVRGGYHVTVDTSVPKSHFHWKIPIYKYCQVLKCQSYFYH